MYLAGGEKLLHFRVRQEPEVRLEVFYLLSRRFPPQPIVSEISYEPIILKQELTPIHKWREVMRLEKEATCRSLAVYALAHAAQLTSKRLLVLPRTNMFYR